VEKWRWERCIKVLQDYDDTEKYIKTIEREIRTPWVPDDENSGISGSRKSQEHETETLWTIQSHKALNQLRKNKEAVDELLSECGRDTETIIHELYIRKFPRYTMTGLVQNHLLSCGRNTAIKLRTNFFEELDRKID